MAIANGLSLPNPLSNGTTADAVAVMSDYNYLLSALNRALLDSGGGAGMNAQSTQIHNLANATAGNDAVNLSQLGSYALLAGAAFTGAVSIATTLGVVGATTLAALAATTLAASGNATIGGTLGVTGLTSLTTLSAASNVTLTANNTRLAFTDFSGGTPFFIAKNDNTFAFYGTDGAGAQLAAWSIQTHNNSPTFSFLVAAAGLTPSTADNSTKLATTAFVQSNLASYALAASLAAYAPLASPVFTGAPAAPTPATADNSTKLATTGYVQANAAILKSVPSITQTVNYTLALSDVGGAVNMNGAGLTLTIPANASLAIPVDSVILVTNLNASNLSIAITSDTLTLSGTTTTGTRTLGQNGEARLRKVSATSWLITGTALG